MRKKVILCFALIIFIYVISSFANGIDWLKNQQNSDGSWGNADKLGFLETVEVLNTFIAASETVGVNSGLSHLENQFPLNTDFTARKLSLFARTNRDFYFILQQLLSQKNLDGGFGFWQNYQSTIWETVLSIDALKDAKVDINEISPSLNYVLINQNTDGGFGFFPGDSSHALATAYCTYILSDFRSTSGVNSTINRSVEWLLSKQHPDSGFGDDGSTIYETAASWLALRSVDMGSNERKEALQYISSRQSPNGSWDNSIYNTALALRAIHEGLRPNLFTTSELITFIPVQPNKGDTVLIKTRVVNNGDVESPSALVSFSCGITPIGLDSTSAIPPQDTANVEISWQTEGFSGLQTITIAIDPENQIKELNEGDNVITKPVFIQDTLPPETLDVWVSNPYFSPNSDGVKDYTRIYFTASEDVTVDILVKDQNLNIVKTIVSGEFYSPGRYSAIWDGTTDDGNIAQDGDYLFEVRLIDTGNNVEIRNAFACVDLNKTTIFASLHPNRIDVKKVYEDELQRYSKYKYYPETDQFIFRGKRKYSNDIYLIVSDAKRTYMDTLDQDPYWGFNSLMFVPLQQKLFYMIGASWNLSPIFEFDLNTHTKKTVIEDSCESFAVSPDGEKIAYVKYSPTWQPELYLANGDGTNRIFVQANAWCSDKWAPNGQYLLYDFENQLWRTDRNGNKIFLLDNAYLHHAYPCHSGNKIAFVRGDSLCLINSDGSNLELLAMLPEVPPPPPIVERIVNLSWHPDDSEVLLSVAFKQIENQRGKVDTLIAGVNRIILSTKESFPVDITPRGINRVDYAENGKRLLYLDENWVLRTCNLSGEENEVVLSPDDFPGGGGPGFPADFTADYTAMLPSDYHYGYSLNNLTVDITALARLSQTPDMLTILGTVYDRNLEKFTVEYGIGQNPSQYFPIYEGNYCIKDTIITAWVPPKSGYYTIKLTGIDKAGNTLVDSKLINWDWETVLTDLRATPDFISPDGDNINDFTTISYYLIHPELLSFSFSRNNKVYKNIYENHNEPGSYSFTWDGTDNYGQVVPDGIYQLKIFGMSMLIVVDSDYPTASVAAQSKFEEFIWLPIFEINALAYDGNFSQFVLKYAHGDTSEFTTLLMGNYTLFRTYPPDTAKFPAPIIHLDLRNCVGRNYVRLAAEDIAGHKKTVRDSSFVDSLFIGCDCKTNPMYPRKIRFEPVIAMAHFPDLSDVEFAFRPYSYPTFLEIGHGKPYPDEDYLYYCDTVYTADSSVSLSDSLIWVKCEVTYKNGNLRVDSILIPLGKGPPPQDKSFRITQPTDSAHVSGSVPVEANFFIGLSPHPECLDKVSFYYFYTEWHNIGLPVNSYPFQIDWVTNDLSNGWYKLRAEGIDTSGVLYSDQIRVYVDNTTPTVLFTSPHNGSFVKDTITINVDAFPNPIAQQYGAVIDYVIMKFISGTDTTTIATDYMAPYSAEFATNAYPDSNYKLIAIAYDSFGHKGNAVITIIIDNTRPTVNITEPLNGVTFVNEDTIDVSGNVFDKYIAYYKLDYRKSDGIWKNIKTDSSNIEGLIAHWDVRSLEPGNYNLRLFGLDRVGYADTSSITISIENSPAPTVELYHPVSGSFIKDTCSISGKVEDDNLTSWVLSYGTGNLPTEWTKIDSGGYNFQGQFVLWNTESVIDTIYTIRLWAIDDIGRTSETKVMVTVDNTLPIDSIIEPTNEQYVGLPIPIIGTASDKNLKNYRIDVGEGVSPSLWERLKIGTTEVVHDTLGQLDPLPGTGTWTIKLTVEDKAENISERQVPIIIDTLPPAPPTGLALQDSLQQVILTWNANTEPDLAGYNAFRNGSKINTGIIPSPSYIDSVFVDGYYTYYVTALDQFNLESKPSDTVSVDIDVTKPIVVISEPQNNKRIHGTIDIIGTANDNHFKSYTIKIGHGSEPEEWTFLCQSYTPVISGKLGTWNTEDLDSIYTIQLKAEDTFGNKDSTRVVTFIDNIPPTSPEGLIASASYDTVELNWLPNPEPDIAGYELFRDSVLVNTSTLITDTFYIETRPDGIYRYYLIAVDLAENHSIPSDTVSVEIDIRAPHAVITDPEQGERVANTVNVVSYVEDNDVKDVTFEFKPDAGTWDTIGVDSIVPFTTQWVTDTLTQGKYYLKTVAEDFHNNIDPDPESIYVFVVKDLDPPFPPQGLAGSVSGDTILLDWLPNSEPDLTGYNVYLDTTRLNTPLVPDTHFIYLPSHESYYHFSITAVDTATNESGHSNVVEVDYVSPEVSITAPQYYERVKDRVLISGTVYDKHLNHYTVSYGAGENPAEWETLKVDSQIVYNDTLAVWNTYNLPDSTYSIRLKAVDDFGNHSFTGIVVYVDYTPPAAPQNLTAELMPDSSIHLRWDPNTEPDLRGYNAYYSLVSGTGYVNLNTEIIGWNQYYTELPAGKTYYFVVTAIDLVKNESGYSNEDSVTTPVEDIDLVVNNEDIIVYPSSPVVGDTALVVANIHNSGSHKAVGVQCDFYVKHQGNYSYLGMDTIPEIQGNSTAPAAINWNTEGYSGTDTLYVFVDPNNQIIETNEENNDAMKEVDVRLSDIIFSISLNDSVYEPNSDVECQLTVVNPGAETINFSNRISVLDSLDDTLNTEYDIESFLYVDDTIPEGSIPFGDFYWDTTLFYKGTRSITHSPETGEYEYGFKDAQKHLSIQEDQALIQYIYLDKENIPSEIMLEFEDGAGLKEHRAYWGANLINRGINNTPSRRYLGALPESGRWIRLVIPADTIGLSNTEIKGASYVLYNGKANWDILDLGLREFEFSLDQGDSLVEKLYWNTKTSSAGYYNFLSSLSFNAQKMNKKKPFRIVAVPGISVDIKTDKTDYRSYEDVTITSTLTNESPNYTYYDVTENIILLDTSGTLYFDTTNTIEVLLPQNLVQTEFQWNAGFSPPGVYRLYEYITKNNDTLCFDSTLFYITPSGGTEIRLDGIVKAEPKLVPYPDSFIVYYSVTNIGNIAIDSLPIRTRILDGVTFDTLFTYIDTLSLLVNETIADTFGQSAVNFTLKAYALTLDAMLKDTVLNIAAGGFLVKDVTPPTIISILPTGVVGGTITIQSEISDDISGVDSASYKITEAYEILTMISGDSLLGVYSAQFNTATLSDGNYFLKVKTKDKADNVRVDSVSITIDNTPPEILITGVQDSTYYNTNVTPTITITEPNLDSTAILLNGTPFTSGTTITDDGEYTLYVYAKDLAGNENQTSLFFIIDKTKPAITISGVSDSTYYNYDVTPIITITDANPDSSYNTLNGNPFISGTTITDEGEYTLYTYAIDKAENTADTSIYFVIDKTSPDPPIMIAPPESSTVAASPITVEGTAEPISYVTLDIGSSSYYTTVNNFGQFVLSDVSLNPNWNLLKFTAKDMAGNISDTSYYHLKLGAEIQLEDSIYVPPVFARILAFGKADSTFIRSVLDSIGVFYKLVSNRSDFEDEFHTGIYNLYLIAGENCELHPHIQDEIIEMVNSGDGLVVTTHGTQHMNNFEEVFSVKFKGHIPANKIKNVIFLESPISEPDTLSISAEVVKFEVKNSTPAAEFNTGDPAAVVNEYGDGKAVFFGFDMTDVDSSRSSKTLSAARIKKYLINAIHWATPDTSLVYPGATIPVEISINNLGDEQRLNSIEVLPGDFTIIAALDSGEISGHSITWNFSIQQDSTAYLRSVVKLPEQVFTDTISAEISYLHENVYVPYDTLYLKISTVGEERSIKGLIDEIESNNKAGFTPEYQNTINEMLSLLNRAEHLVMSNKPKAIENLLDAAKKASIIPEFADVRKKIDLLIKITYCNLSPSMKRVNK